MAMKLTFVWLLAATFWSHNGCYVTAFAPGPVSPKLYTTSRLLRSRHHPSLTRLTYRKLDVDDDDTTMIKAQSRTPIGYDVRRAIKASDPKSAMNVPFIKALLINQSLILALATAATYGALFFTDGFDGISQLKYMLHWSGGPLPDMDLPSSVAVGALAAIPMLAFSTVIENSDNRAFANVNFSTITMVMTLFGRRKAPPKELLKDPSKPVVTTKWSDVLIQSTILAITTGICEESVFRQEVPALLSYYLTGDNIVLTLVMQAVIFALGHASPGSNLAENAVMVGLQSVNGLAFGLIYLLTGGNIISCIAAHSVFDFVVFFKTWMDANAQLEYAESMYSEPLPSDVQREVQQLSRFAGVKIDPQVLPLIKRLFYTFDFDKSKTLSLSEVRKGISYLALEKAGVPPPQAQVDALVDKVMELRHGKRATARSRLDFPDFLLLYLLASPKRMKMPVRA